MLLKLVELNSSPRVQPSVSRQAPHPTNATQSKRRRQTKSTPSDFFPEKVPTDSFADSLDFFNREKIRNTVLLSPLWRSSLRLFHLVHCWANMTQPKHEQLPATGVPCTQQSDHVLKRRAMLKELRPINLSLEKRTVLSQKQKIESKRDLICVFPRMQDRS